MRFVFLLALLAVLAVPATAQTARPPAQGVLLGVGLGPGAGVQVGVVRPALAVFTTEGVLYADYAPDWIAEENRVLVSVGLGASVRVLELLAEVSDFSLGPLGLDAGFRFGPSFFYGLFEQTAASKARSFSLFVEPFGRATLALESGRTVFAELGTQSPVVRGGLMLGL